MQKLQSRLGAIILTVVGAALFSSLLALFPAFSGFGAGVFKYGLAASCVVATDAIVFPRVNTYEELIVKRNLAYAVFWVGYMVVAAQCLSTA